MKQINEILAFRFKLKSYIFDFVEWFLLTTLSIICAVAFIGLSLISFNFNQGEGLGIPFSYFLLALVIGYSFSRTVLVFVSNIGKHNFIFHFFFVLVVLNFGNTVMFYYTFHISSVVYVIISFIYICFACFLGSQGSRIYYYIIIIFSFYTLSIILLNYESFLLFSNFVIYKASKRTRWLRTAFPHITFSSILPAKRAVALYYKDYADTVFTWDHSIWVQVWFTSFISIILFFFCHSLYVYISINIAGLGLLSYLICSVVSIGVPVFVIYLFRGVGLAIFEPVDVLAPVRDVYPLVIIFIAKLDYTSYVLFTLYMTILVLIFRFWLSVLRFVLLGIIDRPFIVDYDYKSAFKLTRSVKTAVYWKFPKKWIYSFSSKRKKFNRSKSTTIPFDEDEDAIYYYGGPNPHMVLFNAITGEIRPIFIKDLVFENYKVYYKLYSFLHRRPKIVNFFPRGEFQSVILPWFSEERYSHFNRINRAPGLSFLYSKTRAAIDFKIQQWLLLLNPDQFEEYEESEKGFFDTQMWESVWYRDFGRKTPTGDNNQFDWLTNWFNPDFPNFKNKLPFRSKTEGNEYLYELAILRHRVLTQRGLWFNHSVGLFPNLVRRLGVKDKDLVCSGGSELNFSSLFNYGLRNFITNSLFGRNSKNSAPLAQSIQFKSLSAISKIRGWFFKYKPKYKFRRVVDNEEFSPDDPSTYFYRKTATNKRVFYLKIFVEVIAQRFLQSELGSGLFKYLIKQTSSRGVDLNYSFSEQYKLEKYTYGWNSILKLTRSQNFRGYLFNKLFRYGFCGWNVNFSIDTNLYKKIDLVTSPSIFSLFNSIENSLIPTLSNFPVYSHLSKWEVEFSGFFEFPLHQRFSRMDQGRFGRFRFVDSKIISNNETSPKINYFFINFKAWYLENKIPGISSFEMFHFIKIYKNFYRFFISKFLYLKHYSKLITLMSAFQTSSTGLSLKPNVFEYKTSFIANPAMHTKIVDPNFTYEGYLEKIYGHFPYNFFDYQLFFNHDKLFSQKRKIFPGSAVSGSGKDVSLGYLYSTTGNFYINSIISSNFYFQMFNIDLVKKYIKCFNFNKFRKHRFYFPTFYSLFDQGSSSSLFSHIMINPIIFNNLQSNYIKNLNSFSFTKYSQILSIDFSVSYNYINKNLGLLEVTWFKSFFLFFSRRRFFLAQKIFSKNSFFKFFISTLGRESIKNKKQIFCYRRNYIYSRKWLYRWNFKLFFFPKKRARVIYYSLNKQPRFRSSSFIDRTDIFFLSNLMFNSEEWSRPYMQYGLASDFLVNFLVGPNARSFFHFWLKRLCDFLYT